ncbi:MAG: PhzF family phenazine biosynthesis protein [Chloroflexota bacterium]
MPIQLYQVDAFSERPFAGNPAGVCLLDGPADPQWMQQVAAEMNLAETAYLYREGDGWRLRWFTPAAEVELCGHATLASAHILWQTGALDPQAQARFHTLSGLLTAELCGPEIELNFPATPAAPVDPPPGLDEALGAHIAACGRSVFDYLVTLESEAAVRSLQPDMLRLKAFPVRGVIVTAQAAAPLDFVSRFFAPAVGVPEDPVTGSAHACLGPYWGARLGKTELLAYQASPRGGRLRLALDGERVRIAGRAVTVMRIELLDMEDSQAARPDRLTGGPAA